MKVSRKQFIADGAVPAVPHGLMRVCTGIGMHHISRPAPTTCVFATSYCLSTCYTVKSYRQYKKSMAMADVKDETFWQWLTGDRLNAILCKKREKVTRIRLMSRGEGFQDESDVHKIKDLAVKNPSVSFWIPTRAWRNAERRGQIERLIFPLKNVSVLASTDRSNTSDEWQMLVEAGWSVMHYDDNPRPQRTILDDKFFRCPKSHPNQHGKKIKGHCETCKGGCFRASSKQVFVHLLEH